MSTTPPTPRLTSENPCPVCGLENFHTSYSGSEGNRMKQTGECFQCAFWAIRVQEGCKIIIDNYCYSVGPEPGINANRAWLGMGGRRFDIEMINTGLRFTTHNLWGGGETPKRFRDHLPNTARFLNGSERAQAGEITCWNPANPKSEKYPSYFELGI